MQHPMMDTMRTLSTLCGVFLGVLLLAGCGQGSDYSGEMAEQHADDTTEPTAMVREPVLAVDAEPVVYGQVDGQVFEGYYAEPARPDSVADVMGLASAEEMPGLVVIHEWWGLNDNIEAMTRRLAGEGYRALAVDLYDGTVAENPDQAQLLMQQTLESEDVAIANLVAAHTYLQEEVGAPEIASIGWCFGGAMSLNTALALPEELDAAVIYYGRLTTDRDELAALDMPILGIFGADDQSIPVETVLEFETILTELGKDVEVHIYDDAGHAFANPTGQNFNASAAESAWDETTSFLREHLYGMDEEEVL